MLAKIRALTEPSEKTLADQTDARSNLTAAEICLLCGGSGIFNRIRCLDCEGTGSIVVVDKMPHQP